MTGTLPYAGAGTTANPSPYPPGGGGGGGSVNQVTAADTSVVVNPTTGNVTVRTGTLDVIATDHAPAANWSNNSHKITSLANGSGAQDAAAYGQTLAGGDGAPLTTAGDLLTMDGTPVPARLAIGTAGQPLTVQSGAPAWGGPVAMGATKITGLANGSAASDGAAFGQIPTSAGTIGGLLASNNLSDVANAATSFKNVAPLTTLGDLIYENATPAPARLAGNTTSTKNFLTQTGNGTISAAPAWGTIAAGDVPTLNQNTTGTASNITDTLDQVPAPAANVSLNSHKITSLANGSASTDAAAFGQILPISGGTMTGALAPAVFTLTFTSGGTTAVNASKGNSFILTLTSSTSTLGVPTNAVDGQVMRIRMIQDSSGSRTIAYSSASGGYDFGTAGSPTLSTGANKVDILGFEYVASLSKWCYLGSGLGF